MKWVAQLPYRYLLKGVCRRSVLLNGCRKPYHEGYGLQPVRGLNRIIGPLGPEGMLFISRPKNWPQGR